MYRNPGGVVDNPFDFDEMKNMVKDGMEQMEAAAVIVTLLEVMNAPEGDDDSRLAAAIEVIRAYGDRRAMNSVGGK